MSLELQDKALRDRLAETVARYEALSQELARPESLGDMSQLERTSREYAELAPTVGLYERLLQVEAELKDLATLSREGEDPDIRELASQEQAKLGGERDDLIGQLREALRPRDPHDERSVIVEIRAGEGGEEAGLWAADLMRVYLRHAERRNWRSELLSTSWTDLGGVKETSFGLKGRRVFSRMKFESGVHRVQRIPVTESGGRIHTSTATVAVLPEPKEIEVDLDENDLRIDVFRSGGHGGQSVNTTDSAVRITHLPSGEVVTCQDERSQLQNKLRAMAVLRARLYQRELERRQSQVGGMRRAQIGRGERAEKIRTYNFRENRVTDHRIGLTMHNLQAVLDGDLDSLIDALSLAAERELVEA